MPAILTWGCLVQKFIEYLASVRQEMMKVTWPTKDELVSATTLVVVFAVVVSLVVWGIDEAANALVYSRITGQM